MTEEIKGTEGVTVNMENAEPKVQNTLLGEGNEKNNQEEIETGKTTIEEYEEFQIPEGIYKGDEKVQEAIKEAKEMFREFGLTQEQGQRLIDLHMKHYLGGEVEMNEMFEEELTRRVKEWGEEVKRNPEYGGSRLKSSINKVKLAISELGGEKLYGALTNETGVINHPAIFGAFVKMGEKYQEDRFVRGSNQIGQDSTPAGIAARIYPGMLK